MSTGRIASRYAKSLIELAQDQGKLDRVMEDMKGFQEALGSRDLYMLIKSPIIKGDKKLSIFKAIFEGKIDELTAAFFNIIIRKGRERFLPEIGSAFEDQYRKINNITKAQVTTATAMNDAQLEEVKRNLSVVGADQGKVELEVVVDPDIIGGFVLEVEDKLYDASVKNKLAKLKKEILDNSYIKSL